MFIRAAAGALLGALLAPAALAICTFLSPAIAFEFSANLPRAITSGFYPVERAPSESFAWTMPLATITLRGIDRDAEWRCTVRMRGARPPGNPQAQAALAVDGTTVVRREPGGAYEDVVVDAPARPGASTLALTISTSPAFVPGPADPRELGVQLDRIVCAPVGAAGVSPPRDALVAGAIAGAAFGLLFTVLSGSLPVALAAGAVFAVALGFVFNTGLAAYSRVYLDWVLPSALWITVPLLLCGAALSPLRRQPVRRLHPATAFVLGFSSAVLFLKILALLHPSKEVVDALFHAHRLGNVLGGNYYFTQPMPGGVQFPYAVGLYVTAAPWASMVPDHVALLRIVVSVAETVAAALLYAAVSRNWNDRLAAAAAVVLYHLAPLPYFIIGNANLTYAFGQSVAVVTLAAAATWPFGRRNLFALAALFAVTSLAFLSHVGVFPVLAVTLVATGVLYWALADRSLRPTAIGIILVAVLAACFAVGSYYAHFPEVYRTLSRVTAPAEQPAPRGGEAPSAPPVKGEPALTIGARTTRAAAHGVRGIGWPIVTLAAAGLWLVSRGPRDRLTLSLGGMGVSFAAFLAFRVLAPVDARYQRYADEFIDRLYYAALPAAAILAARAAAWGWRAGWTWRIAVAALFAASAFIGVGRWMAWIR